VQDLCGRTYACRSRTASEANTIAEPSGARAGVDRAERRRGGVAGRVETGDRRTATAQHPAVVVGDQPALGAEVGEHEARGVVRRPVAGRERRVRPVAAGEERVVLVAAAPEVLVDAAGAEPVVPLDALHQRLGGYADRAGQVREPLGPHPGAGGEVRGRVALGHRDRGQPAASRESKTNHEGMRPGSSAIARPKRS
jgi:hypothetical protein